MFVETPEINAAYHVVLTDDGGIVHVEKCVYLGIQDDAHLFENCETKEQYYLFETDRFVYDSIQEAVSGALFMFDAVEELT